MASSDMKCGTFPSPILPLESDETVELKVDSLLLYSFLHLIFIQPHSGSSHGSREGVILLDVLAHQEDPWLQLLTGSSQLFMPRICIPVS
jgi:hypothetical protein